MPDRSPDGARPEVGRLAFSAVPEQLALTRTDRRSASRVGWLLLVVTACCACAGPGPRPLRNPVANYQPPSTVAASVTLAAGPLAPEVEVGLLQRQSAKPALLRRAWLELQQRRPDVALDTAAEVLFGKQPPSTREESYARYLRALAYEQQGHPERGAYDRERARELALDPELRQLLNPRPEVQPMAAGEPWGSLEVVARRNWRPAPTVPANLHAMSTPTKVTIHHSAMYFRDTQARASASQIARIQREHMQNREYGDIGYHFLIDPSGRIWEGRELRWQGAHASGDHNIGNIGICLLGNFVRKNEGHGPSAAQVDAMAALVRQLTRHYRMGKEALFCHSDFKATECPGPRMAPLVRQLARQLSGHGDQLAAGPVSAAADDED